MSRAKDAKRKPKPHEEAIAALKTHYLLGPVARELCFAPLSRPRESFESPAYCRIAGLVEAIRTLAQPPIPWQAQLAEWMRERFPLAERRRTYARPSRRQSATPDMPRPRFVAPEDDRVTRTFGVVVDTSGSMAREHLGKALGAIVAYAQAQEVRELRLVYCDAQPYDEGWVAIESLASRVSVRGRGGTVLQPALTLLETRRDFPKEAPILVITDGLCESELRIERDHAFLLTTAGRLPFVTRKPVFRMR